MANDRREGDDRVDELAALYDQFNASVIPFFHQLGNLMRRASQTSGRKDPPGESAGLNDSLIPVPEEDSDPVTRGRSQYRNLPEVNVPEREQQPLQNLPDLGQFDTGFPALQPLSDEPGQFSPARSVPIPNFGANAAANEAMSDAYLDASIPEYVVRHPRPTPQRDIGSQGTLVESPVDDGFGEIYAVGPSAAKVPDSIVTSSVPQQASPPPIEEPEEREIHTQERVFRPSDDVAANADAPESIPVPQEVFPTSYSLPRAASINVPRDVEAAGEDLSEYLIDAVQRLADIRDAIIRVLSMQNALLEQDHAKLIQLESALVRLRC